MAMRKKGKKVQALFAAGSCSRCSPLVTASFRVAHGHSYPDEIEIQRLLLQFLPVLAEGLFGESVSPLEFSFERRTCPAEICFPPFRLSKSSGQNYSRLDAWQRVCRMADLLAAIFPLSVSVRAESPRKPTRID
jgi:hypothetical protein